METGILNGHDLKKMLDSGLTRLTQRHKEVDALNVFPVPDGDTGTNMYLTLTSAVQEVSKARDMSSIGEVSEAAARGALMGARGNSGVILSQLLRGLAQGLKNMDKISGKVFAQGLEQGVKVAFKAIMKPVEGTILTVAREAAREAVRASKNNSTPVGILRAACLVGEETLNRTPEMLPILKEAGVVDAGGMGWLVILEGFLCGLEESRPGVPALRGDSDSSRAAALGKPEIDLRYPYCTEVLIQVKAPGTKDLREKLQKLGDSLMVVETAEFTRVHVHSAHPGDVLEVCLTYGTLKDVKVTNMIEQSAEAGSKQAMPGKPFGIISVAFGEGLEGIMKSLGADLIIPGGQTMNPSTRELVEAADKIESDTVVILPNNGNIIMTAAQVASLTDKQVRVIPTKTIPQGLAALLAVMPGTDLEKAVKSMTEAVEEVKTGEVTYAVRDTSIDGKNVEKGSIIGIFDDEIVQTGAEIPNTVLGLLEKMITPDNEVCTLYYGETISTGEAEKLFEILQDRFSHIEFELHYGGQPLYYYIISVE